MHGDLQEETFETAFGTARVATHAERAWVSGPAGW